MSTVRRLYLYGVSAVALTLLCAGAVNLLRLIAEQLAGSAPLGGGMDREGLAVALALLLVGLPLWIVHWWLVERSVRRATPAGDADRRSELRAFYLAVVAAVTLAIGAVSTSDLLERGLRVPLDAIDAFGPPWWEALPVVLVAGAAWAFHVRTRHLDTLAGPLAGAAAWWSRLYLYGAMLGGAIAGLRGIALLIETIGNAALQTGARFGSEAFGWSFANGIALVVIGGAIFLGHSLYARRLTDADDWRRDAERASAVRGAHPVVGLAVAATISIFATAEALRWILAIPLGVGETGNLALLTQQTVGPVVTMLPFLVAGVLYGRASVRDAGRFVGPEAVVDVRRQTRLVLAAIGLAFAAVGAARTFGIGLEQVMGAPTSGYDVALKEELARFAAFAIVGLPVWLVAWAKVQRSGDASRMAEVRSTGRRGYLFLVIGTSVTAAGIAGAFVAYQVIRAFLGIGDARIGADLSQPMAIAIVGIVLVVYHAWVLRDDMADRAALEGEGAAAPAVVGLVEAAAIGAASATIAPVHEELVLEGPPGADLEPVNQLLRNNLPLGWSLRVVGTGGARGQ